MIVSVPHTGTRTLQQHLGEATIFHFCQNEGDFEGIDEPIDFPIRDPLATSISWRTYQTDRTDMDEFRRWDAAIEYLKDREHRIHRIEDLPVLEGQTSDDYWWKQALRQRDIKTLLRLPEVEYLLSWYPGVEWFFKPHYPEGFWWQSTAQQNN